MSSSSAAADSCRAWGATESVFSSPSVFQSGSEKLNASGRVKSRPRLVKVRRHLGSQQGRLGSSQAEIDPGFNPFRAASDAANVNDGGRCNLLDNLNCEFDSVKSENVDFVFGANRSAPAANFSEETEVLGNNVSSSFNMNERGSALNLNSEEKISNCSMRKCAFDQKMEVEEEGKRYEEIGFVFGANETHSVPNSKSGNAKSTRTVGNCKSDDKGKIKIGSNGDCGAGLRESMSEVNNGQRGYCEGSTSFFVDDKENVKVCTGSNSRDAAADVVGPVNSHLDKGGGEGGSSFGASSNRSFNSNASTSSEIFRSIGSDAPNICTGSVMYDCDAKTQSVSELSDEINKLRFDGAHTFKSSEINSSSQPNAMFVFGSNGKNPCSPTRSSVSLACGASAMFTFQAEVPKNFTIEKHLTQVNDVSGMNGSAKPSSSTVPNSCLFEAHKRSTQKQGQENDDADLHGATKPSPSSVPNGSVFEACLGSESSCTSKPEEIGVQFMSPLTPKPEARTSLKEGFCPGLHEQMASAKSRSVKDRKLKKWRGKLKQGTLDEKYSGNDLISDKIGSLGSPNSSRCYSPMDFSPYQEVMTEARCSSTTSTTPHKLSNLDCNLAPSATNSKISAVKDDIISTKESSGIDGDYYIGLNKESFQSQCEKQFIDPKSPYHKSSTNQSCFDSGVSDPSLNVGVSCPKTSRQESNSEGKKIFASSSEDFNRTSFTFSAPSPAQVCPSAVRQESTSEGKKIFASRSEDFNRTSFTFSAPSPAQVCPSSVKHRNRKKYRSKSSHDSASNKIFTCVQSGPSSSQFPSVASSPAVGEAKSQRQGQSIQGNVKSVENEGQVKQQACERWKSRGNQAYRNGKFSKAEEFYTKGISSVPSDEKSEWSLDPLVMCYSNRAAARMSLGKIQEAIGDCMMAVGLDPTFLKAHIRSANCHLLLGEVDKALHHFSTCVDVRSDVCLDRRMIIEASEGKQKAQKVDQCAKKSAELLQKKTYDAAASALGEIDEALSISSYSERLLELKAEALYMLQKYEEVVQLCRKTSDFAEKNLSPYAANIKNFTCTRSLCWRSYLIAKSYFCMGKLEAALDLLEKKQPGSNIVRLCNEHLDSSTKLAASICELLRNKNLGNESFQAGRYLEAVEHYTTALTMNVESKPFAAILFCNRGAAYQALGQLTDAIADTSLAIALDETYQKAISRRASLHEKIRDYDQAANDLRTLISLLEKKSPGSPSTKEINQAQRRLSTMEDESRRGTTMDLYLILGVQASEEASEIKKAYRKAALRHHPDKAGQFLTKSGVGDDGRLWKEIIEKVHRDADRLFKMIGEAYAVLSDPTKRSVYDREEKIRHAPKESNGSSMYPPSQDGCSYPYGNMNRRNWHYAYKTYGNPYSRW